MGSVGIERHVADETDAGMGGLDRRHRAAHQVFRIERLGGFFVLERGVHHRKQGQRGNAQCGGLARGFHQKVYGKPLDAWHGRDGGALVLALAHEDRPDQVSSAESVFAHQGAEPRGPAVAAHAGAGESGAVT